MFEWVGPFLLAVCGIPIAWDSWKAKSGLGVSRWFLWAWFLGDILTWGHVAIDIGWDWPLLVNYTVNAFCVGLVLYYSYFPKGE